MKPLLTCMLLALSAAWAAPANAQDAAYPTQPIRVLVPVAPGGGADFVARLVGERMSVLLGKPVVVENKGGASGIIASQEVARAQPDGYTLLECYSQTHGTGPAVTKLPYDPIRDFVPIGMIGATPNVLVVPEKSPIQSLKDFVEYAKRNPRSMSFASPGVGSGPHLTMEFLEHMTGIDLLHVPYKGAGPAMSDLLAGQIDAMFPGLTAAVSHVKAGKMRALAMASLQRSPHLPQVPTLAELGYGNFESQNWYGLCAPAKTPAAIVRKLNQALNTALSESNVKARLAEQAAEPMPMTPAKFGEYMANDIAKWTKLVKDAHIQIEQ